MRWDALFDDLAAQRAALDHAELIAEVADRTRGEVAGIELLDRFRAALGADLHVTVRGGCAVAGALTRVGMDWLLVTEPHQEAVVPIRHVACVRGLRRGAAVPGAASVVDSRTGIRQPLRALARDRSTLWVHLVDGSVRAAVIDRVGADFIDVAGGDVLAIAAIAAVRRSV